MIKMWNN